MVRESGGTGRSGVGGRRVRRGRRCDPSLCPPPQQPVKEERECRSVLLSAAPPIAATMRHGAEEKQTPEGEKLWLRDRGHFITRGQMGRRAFPPKNTITHTHSVLTLRGLKGSTAVAEWSVGATYALRCSGGQRPTQPRTCRFTAIHTLHSPQKHEMRKKEKKGPTCLSAAPIITARGRKKKKTRETERGKQTRIWRGIAEHHSAE